MGTDCDEIRSDVKEAQDSSPEALKSASAPDSRSVVTELDEADALDEGLTPGGEIASEELIVQVIPQGKDEFSCSSCFLVRHRSQLARESNGTRTASNARARTTICGGRQRGRPHPCPVTG